MMKKRILSISLLFLISSQSTYPLKIITASSLAGLSWFSCFNLHKYCLEEIDKMSSNKYCSEYQKGDAETQLTVLKIADKLGFLIYGIILPTYLLGKLPKARLVHAQECIDTIINKKIMKKKFKNKDDFYAYVAQTYANDSWPLLRAKNELNKYFNQLDSEKKALKKALNDTKKNSTIWRRLYDAWYDIDDIMKKIVVLTNYINIHPTYQSMVKDAGVINAAVEQAEFLALIAASNIIGACIH